MDWMELLKETIDYIEEHLLEDITAERVAEHVNVSGFYFQKGFKIMTGYTIGEYIRYRRLYLAGLEASAGRERILELSLKYGYETPESFTRAFGRFHGISPARIKNQPGKIRTFLPLSVSISVKGGTRPDYMMEQREAFHVVGVERLFSYVDAYEKIPCFWEEYHVSGAAADGCCMKVPAGLEETCFGKYGISLELEGNSRFFRYLIGGDYQGGAVPPGAVVEEIPACTWARFFCSGPMPEALQAVNARIFQEWLPTNRKYTIAAGVNLELYDMGDIKGEQYKSEIWIPVKENRISPRESNKFEQKRTGINGLDPVK